MENNLEQLIPNDIKSYPGFLYSNEVFKLKEGDVVSATLWNLLHNTLFKNLVNHDSLLKESSVAFNNIINKFIQSDEGFKILSQTVCDNHNEWVAWRDAHQNILDTVVQNLKDTTDMFDSLSNGMVHFGTEEPKNDKIRVWVQPIELSSEEQDNVQSVTRAELKNTLQGYAAATRIPSKEQPGVVTVDDDFGITVNPNTKCIEIVNAAEHQIQAKTGTHRPITPSQIDLAVKTGVATNNIPLTADEKKHAQDWLGLLDIVNNCAGAVTQDVSGASPLVLTDANCFQQPISVQLEQIPYVENNTIYINVSQGTRVVGGLTITSRADGTLHIKGTTTQQIGSSTYNVQFDYGPNPHYSTVGPNTPIYLGYKVVSGDATGLGMQLVQTSDDTTYSDVNFPTMTNIENVYTIPEANPQQQIVACYMYVDRGVTLDCVVLPYFTTTSPNAAEFDFRTVTVSRYGPNLLRYPYDNDSQTLNGVTFTFNDDGTITANGKSTASTTLYLIKTTNKQTIPAGDYIISGTPEGGSSNTCCLKFNGTVVNKNGNEVGYSDSSTFNMAIYVARGKTLENVIFKPCVSLKNIYNGFVSPTPVQISRADEHGVVKGLTSLNNYTVLCCDTAHIAINCTYHTDTKTYIDNKFEELRTELSAAILNS